ncbi:hypothetical protein AAMO2058_000024300 [Amorphochlora amoebiformis]
MTLDTPLPVTKGDITAPPKGVFDLSVPAMKSAPVSWFSDLLANKTINQPDKINILLYNDDPCGADLFGLRVEPFIRIEHCGTPVRLYSSRHRGLIDKMDIVIISLGWSERLEGFNTPFVQKKKPGQIWVSCSVENGVTYPRTPEKVLKNKYGMDLVMSPSFKADVYISFYSHFYLGGESIRSTLRGIKPLAYEKKTPKIVIMNAACNGKRFEYRNSFVEGVINNNFTNGYVESIGRCWRNSQPRSPWVDDGLGNRPMAFHMNKMANIRPYMFTLCHESTELDGWVTEKVYHALAMGSIPIYRGSRSIKQFIPCENCIIDTRDFPTIDQLAIHLKKVITDRKLHDSYHAWRAQPYDATKFPIFDELILKRSIDTAICRVANYASDTNYRHKASAKCDSKCLEEVYKFQRLSPHG